MINHKPLKLKRHELIDNRMDVLCAGERVGVIYDVDGMVALTTFNNSHKEVETFDEGLRFVENELNEFISNISK